jgi:hypothetical protein
VDDFLLLEEPVQKIKVRRLCTDHTRDKKPDGSSSFEKIDIHDHSGIKEQLEIVQDNCKKTYTDNGVNDKPDRYPVNVNIKVDKIKKQQVVSYKRYCNALLVEISGHNQARNRGNQHDNNQCGKMHFISYVWKIDDPQDYRY